MRAIRRNAPSPRAVSIVALLSLAACGSMNGSSSQTTQAVPASIPASAPAGGGAVAGTVVGTVSRSGSGAAGSTAAGNPPTVTTAGVATPADIGNTDTIPGAASTGGGSVKTVPAPTSAASLPKTQKSIRGWVSCSGTADDTSGTMKAFAAAKNRAFTLVVDCPVRLRSGLAIDHSIFIDNGTAVQFSGSGKFFVDNMFHPAFVIANSSNVSLLDWNVEWDGAVPANPNFGGYELGGRFVASPGITQPAGAFNDLVLTPWLAANRGIVFNESQGWVKSVWIGGINPAAVFFITGDTSNVIISGMKLYAPSSAGAYQFMPMAFSLSPNWKSNQMVTGKSPLTAAVASVPHGLTVTGLDLDGYLMGFQGSAQDSMFENITAHRYSDLQDANGGNVGGLNKWFPPPHLFYFNTHSTDPSLFNTNVRFHNIQDQGIRLGVARDKGGGDSTSGYANSIKLGCTDCSVDGYVSHRPDGFMDVLNSDGLTVSDVVATFDSTFINNLYPAGLRFPDVNYAHISFEGIQMTDTPETTTNGPVGNATNPTNQYISLTAIRVTMNKWGGEGAEPALPTIKGSNITLAITYSISQH